MVNGRRDPSDVRGPGTRLPRSPTRRILTELHPRRVHPDNILLVGIGPREHGGKSDVFRATLVREPDRYNRWQESKIDVAVKKLRFHDSTNQNKNSKAFVNELKVLDGLCHPNVAKLEGFVEDLERGIAWLVSRWEPNRNVRDFLLSAKCSIPERFSLIQDTLEGLFYLHTRKPPICHGDLKSLNILVSASYNAVITDFGSARVLRERSENGTQPSPARLQPANHYVSTAHTHPNHEPENPEPDLTLTNAEGTLHWTAPEVLMGEQPDLPSDIWAAAWTCWEIVTDKHPFSDVGSERLIDIMTSIIEGKVPLSIRGEQMSQIRNLFRLMMVCWALEPRDRPSAEEFLAEVRRLPSSIPSSPTRLGFRIRSTALLCHPDQTRYLTSDFKRAKSMHHNALEIARSTENPLAAANTWFGLGHAFYARGEYPQAEEAYVHAQLYYAKVDNLAGRARTFEELGSVYRVQCIYSNAEVSYLLAKSIYASLKDYLGRASALCGLGDVYRARCKYEAAEEFYQEARGIHARSGADQGRAKALLGLGEVYSAQCRYRKAEVTFLHARDMCSSLRDDAGRANALSGLGDVYRAQRKHGEAEEAYRGAHTLYVKVGDKLGGANALLGLGEVYHARTKYSEAEAMFKQAQAIHEEVGSDVDRVNALLGLGEVYRAQRVHEEAGKLFHQALSLSAQTDNDLGRANALRGLGDVHHTQQNFIQAADSFTLALNLYDRIRNDLGCADALLGLGYVYRSQIKWDEAEESFAHAQYIYARIHNNEGRANSLSGLGDVYHALFLYNDAEQSYRQAYDLYTGLADDIGKGNALFGLGEACVAQAKYSDAGDAFMRAQTVYAEIGDGRGHANALRALELLRRIRSKHGEEEKIASESEDVEACVEACVEDNLDNKRPETASKPLEYPNRFSPFFWVVDHVPEGVIRSAFLFLYSVWGKRGSVDENFSLPGCPIN